MMGDLFKWTGAAIAAVAVGICVLLLVASMFVFGFGWFQRETADFRGGTDAIEQTKGNGDFRVQSYQGFFDKCSSIQSLEDRIRTAEEKVERLEGTPQQADAYTELDALLARRSQLVREYNSDASAGFTVGQFRDSDLPYNIIIIEMETQCA